MSEDPTEADRRHELRCALCGTVAVVFRIGLYRWTGEMRLIVEGIARTEGLPLDDAERIFDCLKRGDVLSVHSRIPDGIDAYCTPCGLIYCAAHSKIQEEWDEEFYDCTQAVCPMGHQRQIAD